MRKKTKLEKALSEAGLSKEACEKVKAQIARPPAYNKGQREVGSIMWLVENEGLTFSQARNRRKKLKFLNEI